VGQQVDVASLKGWRTVMEPNGTDLSRSHFVTGNWPPRGHPLYSDDKLVGDVTDWLTARGQTVYQLFMLYPDERMHSISVLGRVNAPQDARVISLGCGIGGMERYWHQVRHDLRFTLVNASRAQLDRCVCPGDRVQADMRDAGTLSYIPDFATFDVAVLGYSLHHCTDVPHMLDVARACLRPGGTLLVLDVVDGSPAFAEVQQYETLKSLELQQAGLVRLDYGLQWYRLPEEVLGARVCEMLAADTANPSMWLGMA